MILAAPAFGVQSTSVPCERWVCKQALGMLGGLVGWATLASLCRVASPPPHGPLQSQLTNQSTFVLCASLLAPPTRP